MKNQSAINRQRNTQILLDTDFMFRVESQGRAIIFREPGAPRIDFFPGTNRWRDVDTKKMYEGDAHDFIDWYKQQLEEDDV